MSDGVKKGVSRTNHVAKNILWAIINQAMMIALSLISRKIFLNVLGAELLGANSLFSDVISLFSFADLGFGTAVVFSLYKPIAENDQVKIKSLLQYYNTIYRYVIIVLIAIAIAFVPFLPSLKTTIPLGQLTFYYFLYQASCVLGYVCAYRETYVSACQKQRTITKFGILFSTIQILLQIVIVKITANYAAYIILGLIISIIRKITVNLYIIKKYPETRVGGAITLPKEERKEIFKSAKAVLVHRLGNLAINQTDSLIVSIFINMTEWGLMSNYLVLKTAVSRLLENVYSAILPSMGNLVTSENEERQIKVFNTYDFINFWLYMFCYVALGTLSSQFIKIYFGQEYALRETTVFIFFTAFFIDGLRAPVSAMREANGSFRIDQWYTILAAFVNLIVSIALVGKMGLNGIYLGTCCAMWVLHVARTILLFRNWNDINAFIYLLKILKYILFGSIVYILTFCLQRLIGTYLENSIFSFFMYGLCACIVPNICVVLAFREKESFKDTMILFKKRLLK